MTAAPGNAGPSAASLGAAERSGSTAKTVRVGRSTIGDEHPVFLIAEIGTNHGGSVAVAKTMVDRAVDAGADCVKFQLRSPRVLFANGGDANDPRADLGAQYVLDQLARAHLTPEQMNELFAHARARGVECLCTPWDLESLDVVVAAGLPALKVASADLTNHELLEAMAATRKPLLVSTGMSTEREVCAAVSLLERHGAQFVLLHCVSTYPPPLHDLRLRYLGRLRRLAGGFPIGYSGHERGWTHAVAAVALGARVIEKHFTLDRDAPGLDHKVSLLPEQFRDMVCAIRELEPALGDDSARTVSHGERLNRSVLAKSLVAARAIVAGERISQDMISIRSPGQGLPPARVTELVGRHARRDVPAGNPFFESDLTSLRAAPRPYRFRRRWGVPVRFHDFAELTSRVTPDFVEFHLGYKDLELRPERFLSGSYDMGYTVHCPDQFGDDHVLDLSVADTASWRRSIASLQQVIDLARVMAPYFPRTQRPLVIATLGGFSSTVRVPRADRAALYDRVAAGLRQLDTEGVELVPQTLPPCPWHFGGQRIGNLFVEAADIVPFCEAHGVRVCLDVAHTYMAARFAELDFIEECRRLAPWTAHLHLADASGVDGEGHQIEEGEIDFASLADCLNEIPERAGFIPEVWEGHWGGGEGFWTALDRLERWFGAEAQE